MSKFENYLKRFDIAANVTDEELEKTQALLQLYGPTLRRSSRRLEEFEEECYESRRQSVSDFINLAVDYDRDTDRKRIAERLIEMGHSMQLLSMLDDALLLVKDEPTHGQRYFDILSTRYFNAYCNTDMKQGALIYDPCLDRMDIRFGLNTYLGGLHCGECFDVWTGSHWEATRIEKGEDWYLVGISFRNLVGLRVRIHN